MADQSVPTIMYGVENLVKIAGSSAKLLSIASQLIHKNFLALFQLSGPLTDLQGVNFPVALLELKDLQPDERVQVEAAFTANLSVVDPVAQAKIISSISYVDEGIALVAESIGEVQKVVDYVGRLKTFLGV